VSQRCRYCDAPIEWAFTVKGSRIPLDPGSHRDGNINVGADGIAHVVAPGDGVRVSHFATCPQAGRARRRGPARR
jgi:hypothetical protein